jgi:hypothetical protein
MLLGGAGLAATLGAAEIAIPTQSTSPLNYALFSRPDRSLRNQLGYTCEA